MALLDTNSKRVILASKSPRRIELLKKILSKFDVVASDVSESLTDTADPADYVMELSKRKALDVAGRIGEGIVIGADSVVVLDGAILGKPRDATEATEMLTRLSGKVHKVYTGLTIVQVPQGNITSDFEVTDVTFRELQSWEIESYVATQSPLDKAGAYGIQDESGVFARRINGCFYNVMGLPLAKLFVLLLPYLKNPKK